MYQKKKDNCTIPTRNFPWITQYMVLTGGSCIRGLLPKNGSKGKKWEQREHKKSLSELSYSFWETYWACKQNKDENILENQSKLASDPQRPPGSYNLA